MANENAKMIEELSEVFKTLSKAFYEKKEIKKNGLIQEAEVKVLSIQTRLLTEAMKGLDA